MSLDRFVAYPNDGVGRLLDWYDSGDTTLRWPGMGMVSRLTAASAGYLSEAIEGIGTIVVGRRVYDYTGGGRRPSAGGAAVPGDAPAARVLADTRRALHRRP